MVRVKSIVSLVVLCVVSLVVLESSERKMFVLEGNGGAGKSTLLRILGESLSVDIILEPVEKWRSVEDSGNLLELFFKDPRRWATTFQSYVLVSRLQTILAHQKAHATEMPQILERSVYCDCYCFAKNCYESGYMTEIEWQVYREWFSLLIENYTQKPSGFIYLRTSPAVCFERVKRRARPEEDGFSLEFLTTLHRRHEDWLMHKRDIPEFLRDVPVLVVDGDEEFECDEGRRVAIIEQIDAFMRSVSLEAA